MLGRRQIGLRHKLACDIGFWIAQCHLTSRRISIGRLSRGNVTLASP